MNIKNIFLFISCLVNFVLFFMYLQTPNFETPQDWECVCPETGSPSIRSLQPSRSQDSMKEIFDLEAGRNDALFTFLPPRNFPNTSKFAYIFYATSDASACNVLIVSDKLKSLGQDPSISTVVVYPGGRYTSKFEEKNITVIATSLWKNTKTTDPTWRESLTKLKVFDHYGFDRMVYIDSDSMPLANLDHLFSLPPGELYAPRAFWLSQPFFSSTLMVIMPTKERFQIISKMMNSLSNKDFDMDILNKVFGNSVNYLPNTYVVPNGRFRRSPNDPLASRLAKSGFLSHLFDTQEGRYGKFWNNHYPTKDSLKSFHPMFWHIFEENIKRRTKFCY